MTGSDSRQVDSQKQTLPPEVCGLSAASSQGPELGLMLCSHPLELTNSFIVELVLWTQNSL